MGNDKRTQNVKIQLNNAESALNGKKREVEQNNDTLNKAKKEFDDAEKRVDDFGDEVKDTWNQSAENGGKFEMLGTICKTAGATIGVAFASRICRHHSRGKIPRKYPPTATNGLPATNL